MSELADLTFITLSSGCCSTNPQVFLWTYISRLCRNAFAVTSNSFSQLVVAAPLCELPLG